MLSAQTIRTRFPPEYAWIGQRRIGAGVTDALYYIYFFFWFQTEDNLLAFVDGYNRQEREGYS